MPACPNSSYATGDWHRGRADWAALFAAATEANATTPGDNVTTRQRLDDDTTAYAR
jgi:hypothetical protein